jgi:hypothetical protein
MYRFFGKAPNKHQARLMDLPGPISIYKINFLGTKSF